LNRPPVVAIIGARRCTKYGEDIAYHAAYELAQHGVVIVSGMAYGIDACAHRGCLDAGGTTIAVLGTAIDNLYPRSNFGLAQRILEKGAIISEYGPGIETRAYYFQIRNRIVSGLADAVLIVEAALNSGTFGTYDFALKQGKDIFAVPADITRPMSAGTNQMLREAANPYIDVSDILIRFSMNKQKVERDLSGLNEIEREVYRLIEDGIGNADEIVLRLNLTAVEFNCAITTLELGGYVARLGEAWVSR
jgi:DNA processing protein